MKIKIILEKFSLGLTLCFVALAMICFSIFLVKETLNWVIFPKLGEEFFYISLSVISLAIFVFAMFNLALNVSIVSNSILVDKKLIPTGKELFKMNIIIVGILFVFFMILFSSLYFINKRNIGKEIIEVKREIQVLKDNNSELLDTIVNNFREKSNPLEIVTTLEAISLTSPYFRDLRIVYPIHFKDRIIFRSFRGASNLSQRDIERFFDIPHGYGYTLSPNKFELEYLIKATEDKSSIFKDGAFVRRPDIKIYFPLKDKENNTIIFLFSEGHRYGIKEYK